MNVAAANGVSPARVVGLLILLGLAWLAWRVIECVFWPFEACPRCDGAGKFRSPSGRAWRACKRCKGSGRRVRFGRRMWDRAAESRRRANR